MEFSVFQPENNKKEFHGISFGESYFFIFSSAEISEEKGKLVIDWIRNNLDASPVNSMEDMDEIFSSLFKELNLPALVSYSSGFINNTVMYLKTSGEGRIYLKKGTQVKEIIHGENRASGWLEEGDLFVFSLQDLESLLGGETGFKKLTEPESVNDILENFRRLTSIENKSICLFVKIKLKDSFIQDTNKRSEAVSLPKVSIGQKFFSLRERLKERYGSSSGKKRFITSAVVIVLVIIFFWSVILGYERKKQEQITKNISQTKEMVNNKVKEAEDASFLDIDKANELLSQAKESVNKLKKELNDQRTKEISEIEKTLEEGEARITKKENKSYSEFYDLTLDKASAKGSLMSLSGSGAVISDDERSTVYFLDLDSKSLNKKTMKSINVGEIASNNGEAFIFDKDKGIFSISAEKDQKKIIDKDSDWGNIASLVLYGSNIYLLDSTKGDIYKYVPIENGYSAKSSYFKFGKSLDLTSAMSMAIDSSVYVSFENSVVKFTGGVQDSFKSAFPTKNVTIDKIYTDKELDDVFVLDKGNSAVYILSKSGEYKRELNSTIFSKAKDFFVYKNNIYVLVDSKILTVSLD